MDTQSTEELQSLSEGLKALSKAELIALILEQRQAGGDRVPLQPSEAVISTENRATESQGSVVPSGLGPRLVQPRQIAANPSRSRSAWLMLLISLGLHGLLLAIPVPTPPAEEEVTEEPEFLIPMTGLPSAPTEPAPTEPEPPPEVAPPPEPSPVPQVVAPPPAPIPPLPQAAPPPAIQPAPPATPQPAPQPTPQAASPPEPEPVDPVEPIDLSPAIAPPEPEPEPEPPAGPTEISGVPVSSDWQLISQFQDLQQKTQVSDSQWYSGNGGQLRDDIVGLLQVPSEDFDGFWDRYQAQLQEAGFRIRPQGRAPGGAILYQLTRESGNGRLYLSVESIEAENEILLGIWNRYPW